jgi:hypothetical protein
MVGNLGHYQQAVSAEYQQAQHELGQAAQWRGQERGLDNKGLHYLVGFGLMLGLPIVVVIAGVVALESGLLSQRQAPFISFAAIGAAMIGVVIYGIWYTIRTRSTEQPGGAAGVATVACPNCGAPHALPHGQALDRCGYCAAALIPSTAVINAGLDAARLVARRARLERWRSERSLSASYQAYGVSGGFILMIAMGPLTLCMGAVGFISSWEMVTGEADFDPLIFVLWGMFFGSIGFAVLTMKWLSRRKKTLRQACDTLALQFHGRPIASLQEMVSWLNAYWAAPYPASLLSQGGHYGGAMLMVDGYAVLVEFAGTSDRYRDPRLLILVAAWFPGLSDGTGPAPHPTPAAQAGHARLASDGYKAEQDPGGVFVRANEGMVNLVRKDTSALAHLAPTLSQAVHLARSLGGVPVEAVS